MSETRGAEPFELYKARTKEQKKCFSDFCIEMDEAYARRMERVIRRSGYNGPIEFSNLWRGEADLRVRRRTDGVIEDHAYDDPLVVKNPERFFWFPKTALTGEADPDRRVQLQRGPEVDGPRGCPRDPCSRRPPLRTARCRASRASCGSRGATARGDRAGRLVGSAGQPASRKSAASSPMPSPWPISARPASCSKPVPGRERAAADRRRR